MKLLKPIIASMAVLAFSFALAAGPGNKLAHDQIQRLSTAALQVHQDLAPKLHIERGCQPFAAVDDNGNYNAGLQDSGSENGGCSSSPSAQAYARSACEGEFCGHMFAYYMPKDNGVPFPSLGHRHDFEEVVIWTKNSTIIGAAYSAHGDYNYHNNPYMSGGRVNPAYDLDGVTHSMATINNNDRDKGTVYPVASWDFMTDKARQAFNDTSNFTTSVVPFRNNNFYDKINEARLGSVNVTFKPSNPYPSSPIIALKSFHNTYFAAENGGGSEVNANRTSIGAWEKFVLASDNPSCISDGDAVALMTSDFIHYFSAKPDGRLTADYYDWLSWETFTLTNHTDKNNCLESGDQISLKSHHNRYVAAEVNGEATANRTSIGGWEKFVVIFQ